MEQLYQKLVKNGQSDYYPYHMPGHKRKPLTEVLRRVADIDITEIDGFDNLHQAEDILKEVQEHAAKVFGAEESFYLVNGSTSGILSAVSAVLPKGGHLLMSRNCHKAAYHSAYLNSLKVTYLLPEKDPELDLQREVTADQVEVALEQNQDIGAVLIVSPTYEGVTSDIKTIADIVHKRGIPLIVDEAHGAHFGFHPAWPESACRQGADIVIQSLHKTLPSMTQTALLHVSGELVDRQRLRRFLSIYQTSSPSYVFMAGMEQAVSYMEHCGRNAMEDFLQRWNWMLRKLAGCKKLKIHPSGEPEPGQDMGKLVISVKNTKLSGQQLYDILLKRFHLQPEMAGGTYVLAMFTVADTDEGFWRMAEALLEIDREITEDRLADTLAESSVGIASWGKDKTADMHLPQKQLEIYEAWDREKELVEVRDCAGCLAGGFVNLYPPGIPVIVPGEVIDESVRDMITWYIGQNLPVQGITEQSGKQYIQVLKSGSERKE